MGDRGVEATERVHVGACQLEVDGLAALLEHRGLRVEGVQLGLGHADPQVHAPDPLHHLRQLAEGVDPVGARESAERFPQVGGGRLVAGELAAEVGRRTVELGGRRGVRERDARLHHGEPFVDPALCRVEGVERLEDRGRPRFAAPGLLQGLHGARRRPEPVFEEARSLQVEGDAAFGRRRQRELGLEGAQQRLDAVGGRGGRPRSGRAWRRPRASGRAAAPARAGPPRFPGAARPGPRPR